MRSGCHRLWRMIRTCVKRERGLGREVMPERVASAAAMAPSGSALAITTWAAGWKNSSTSGDTWSSRFTTCSRYKLKIKLQSNKMHCSSTRTQRVAGGHPYLNTGTKSSSN